MFPLISAPVPGESRSSERIDYRFSWLVKVKIYQQLHRKKNKTKQVRYCGWPLQTCIDERLLNQCI